MSRNRQESETRLPGPRTPASKELGDGEEVLLGDLHLEPNAAVPCRSIVEPFLSALLQIEHLNLLIGSGLTTALTNCISFDNGVDMQTNLPVEHAALEHSLEDAAIKSAASSQRGEPNIEDRLRVALAAVEGLRHLEDSRAELIRKAVDKAISNLRDSVTRTEKALYEASDRPQNSANEHLPQSLLTSFLRRFAGRSPTRDRLHIFTTNYDRVIEWGADSAGLRMLDRFVGSLQPVFRSSRLELDYHYSPPGTVRDPRYLDGVFRFTKLHGSLDWRSDLANRRVVRIDLPFGKQSSDGTGELLIYPQASKDIETTFYPYVELFRDFAGATCRPHSALVTYGYGFGDDHINRIIVDMLTIPSTHLLIISYDDKDGRIRQFISSHRHSGQVGLLIGPTMADLGRLVYDWLPQPSTEFLLQKQAELVRERSSGMAGTTNEHRQ